MKYENHYLEWGDIEGEINEPLTKAQDIPYARTVGIFIGSLMDSRNRPFRIYCSTFHAELSDYIRIPEAVIDMNTLRILGEVEIEERK